MKIKVESIMRDGTVQIRDSLHRETVEHYADVFDELPPIIVVQTGEGLVLADGFHRLAAAEEIEAEVRPGTLRDAQVLAATANAKHGRPLTPGERHAAIIRLAGFKYGEGAKIARALSMPRQTVEDHLRLERLMQKVPGARKLTDGVALRVIAAPEKYQEPLVKAASVRGWSREDASLAVKNLGDKRCSDEHRQKLLAGEVDPMGFTPNGEPTMSLSTPSPRRQTARTVECDPGLPRCDYGHRAATPFQTGECRRRVRLSRLPARRRRNQRSRRLPYSNRQGCGCCSQTEADVMTLNVPRLFAVTLCPHCHFPHVMQGAKTVVWCRDCARGEPLPPPRLLEEGEAGTTIATALGKVLLRHAKRELSGRYVEARALQSWIRLKCRVCDGILFLCPRLKALTNEEFRATVTPSKRKISAFVGQHWHPSVDEVASRRVYRAALDHDLRRVKAEANLFEIIESQRRDPST